jgi:hypothetical protein
VHKRRFLDAPPGRFEEIERADGVGVEIVEGNRGRPVMGRLGRGMDDSIGPQLGDEPENSLAIADVDLVVGEAGKRRQHPLLIPAGVAGGPEEHGALVVVDAVDGPALFVEVGRHLAADQARRSRDQESLRHRIGSRCLTARPGHGSCHDRAACLEEGSRRHCRTAKITSRQRDRPSSSPR